MALAATPACTFRATTTVAAPTDQLPQQTVCRWSRCEVAESPSMVSLRERHKLEQKIEPSHKALANSKARPQEGIKSITAGGWPCRASALPNYLMPAESIACWAEPPAQRAVWHVHSMSEVPLISWLHGTLCLTSQFSFFSSAASKQTCPKLSQ